MPIEKQGNIFEGFDGKFTVIFVMQLVIVPVNFSKVLKITISIIF
jgi:hypothetical protein